MYGHDKKLKRTETPEINQLNIPNKPSAEGASELRSAEGAPEPKIVRRTLRKSNAGRTKIETKS